MSEPHEKLNEKPEEVKTIETEELTEIEQEKVAGGIMKTKHDSGGNTLIP